MTRARQSAGKDPRRRGPTELAEGARPGSGPGPWGGKKPPKSARNLAAYGGQGAVKSMALREIAANLPAVPKREAVDDEAERECLNWVASGGSISSYARATGLPYHRLWSRLKRDYPKQLDEANESGADAIAEGLLRIAVTPDLQTERTEMTDADGSVRTIEKTSDAVFARKLAVWAGLELLKTRAPEKYGKKTTTEVNVTLASAITRARERVREQEAVRPVIDAEVVEASAVQPAPAQSASEARRLAFSRVAGPSASPSPQPSSVSSSPDGPEDWI